jgi:TRAP-type mannitol/chloroaromatic compound transport system permease small subunit
VRLITHIKQWCRGIENLNAAVARLCGLLLIAAIMLSAGNALARFILHRTSNAALEMQGYLFSAVFLLASAHVLRQGHHIRIDVIITHVPMRVRRAIMLIGHSLFTLPLCAVMIWQGSLFAWQSLLIHETSINIGGLWVWPAKALIPLSFMLIALEVCAGMIRIICGDEAL